MMPTADALDEILALDPRASVIEEGGLTYIYLPVLILPDGAPAEALLCLAGRDGYPTRLFLSRLVSGKGNNWSLHRILDKAWHTWSWKDVPPNLRPIDILMSHLDALR
jgi:hypothetical protein